MEDIAPQRRKFYRRLYGGGSNLPPTTNITTIQTSSKLCDFAELYRFVGFPQITFILGNFTNFKAFFPAMLTDFR